MKNIILISVFSLLLISTAFAASKESYVKKGNALYGKGEFAQSLKSYEDALKADPESPVINFNLGTALYKNKKYQEAIPYLQKSLLSDDPVLNKNAHFNLGDVLFKQGISLSDQQVDQSIAALEESLRQFTTVLNVDDKDKDAQYNRDIVQKELERLKKNKKQEQTQNKDQQKDQQEQNKDQEQKDNSSQTKSDKENSQQKTSQSEDKNSEQQGDEQKPEQGFSQSKDAGDKNEQAKDQGSLALKPGEMTKEEAQALLQQFEQSDESSELLNFDKNKISETSVLKDW